MKRLKIINIIFIFLSIIVSVPALAQGQRQVWDQMPTYVPPSPTKEPPPSRAPLASHTSLEVYNNTSAKIRICLNYYDNRRLQRINEGWWEVKPYSSERITLFTTDPSIAYYAYTLLGRKWEGRRGNFDAYPTKVSWENFISREGTVPPGAKGSPVIMKRVMAQNRRSSIIFGP